MNREAEVRGEGRTVTRITNKVRKLIKDMLDHCDAALDGEGLAAPQIGVSKQIVVIDVGEGPI